MVLKENQEGFGWIIESMTSQGCSGYVSLDIQDKGMLLEYENKDSKAIFMNCILQKCDTQNKNGRFYPREILTREDKKYQQLIKEGNAFGATDHPEVTFVSLKKEELSHRVVKSWWEGNTLMGVLEIITSPAYDNNGIICTQGDFIANLLSKGSKIGISSRGIGSLRNIAGRNTVQSDFELICYDLVSTPSTPGAYLYPKEEINLQENFINHNVLTNNTLNNKLKNFLKK